MPMQRAFKSAAKVAAHASRQINAVVVSSGLMAKTVKYFNATSHLLVHDPNSSLRTGDVISISPGWRTSKTVRHVVSSIIAPFGTPISERPPIPTAEERIAGRERKLMAKDIRKGKWSRWGFEKDPRGVEGGEWYVEGWGKQDVVKPDASVNGEEVRPA
ncbi:hypothetical protein DSL72_003304 [Monilinia vaccinii-corymbosi]|uniref:Uncharacterized protein n=1 Tax=Monilinia vaccinii-corymbosi TaxID=61207 RepID=A0A8A3P7S5_9HELO|nr:hypothetical protein DSL72_003304 [Monilinia vaccinii-corymbosi]